VFVASEAGAARALDGTPADAEVRWLADDGVAGPAPEAAVSAAVVIDLEGAPANLTTDAGRAWIGAVRPGGALTVSVGPDRSWAAVLDALEYSGRTWRIVDVTAHPPVVHVALRLDPDRPAEPEDTFRSLAEAAARLGSEYAESERACAGASEASSGQARMAAGLEADYDAAIRDLDRTRRELDRIRRELHRAQSSLDRFRRSPPGRLLARYRSLRRRLVERHPG
jgi:hypothetical protein